MEIKKHPGWKNAVETILKRFDNEGYGVMFSNKELDDMFDIEQPGYGSYEDFQKFSLERLTHMDELKRTLLSDYNLCLDNSRGNGYVLMHPNDQIVKTAQKYKRKARKGISQMISILTCVDNESLSAEGRQKQVDMLGKAAFIRAALNKRKILPDLIA